MSQAVTWNVPTSGPGTMQTFAGRCSPSLDALNTIHSGAARPSYAVPNQLWLKIASGTEWDLYCYDGTSDILIGTFNPASHLFTLSPTGLGFASSDLARVSITPQAMANSRMNLKAGTNSEGLIELYGAAAGNLDEQGIRFLKGNDGSLLASLLYQISTSSIQLLDSVSAESIRLQLDGDIVSKLFGTLSQQVVPPGAIVHGPWTAAPTGFLIANGALVSKTTYARLWGYGTKKLVTEIAWQAGAYGAFVDYSISQFRIPMLQGVFGRSVNDESVYTIGTYYADAVKQHNHGITDPQHAHGYTASFNQNVSVGGTGQAANAGVVAANTVAASTGITVNNYPAVAAVPVDETRPRGIPLLACIKY